MIEKCQRLSPFAVRVATYCKAAKDCSLLPKLTNEKDNGVGTVKARRNVKLKRVDEQSVVGNGNKKTKNSHVLTRNNRTILKFDREHSQRVKYQRGSA